MLETAASGVRLCRGGRWKMRETIAGNGDRWVWERKESDQRPWIDRVQGVCVHKPGRGEAAVRAHPRDRSFHPEVWEARVKSWINLQSDLIKSLKIILLNAHSEYLARDKSGERMLPWIVPKFRWETAADVTNVGWGDSSDDKVHVLQREDLSSNCWIRREIRGTSPRPTGSSSLD